MEGWDRPEVEITVIKSIDHEYESKQREQAAKRLERVHVDTERRSDSELAISTTALPQKRCDPSVRDPRAAQFSVANPVIAASCWSATSPETWRRRTVTETLSW